MHDKHDKLKPNKQQQEISFLSNTNNFTLVKVN